MRHWGVDQIWPFSIRWSYTELPFKWRVYTKLTGKYVATISTSTTIPRAPVDQARNMPCSCDNHSGTFVSRPLCVLQIRPERMVELHSITAALSAPFQAWTGESVCQRESKCVVATHSCSRTRRTRPPRSNWLDARASIASARRCSLPGCICDFQADIASRPTGHSLHRTADKVIHHFRPHD